MNRCRIKPVKEAEEPAPAELELGSAIIIKWVAALGATTHATHRLLPSVKLPAHIADE